MIIFQLKNHYHGIFFFPKRWKNNHSISLISIQQSLKGSKGFPSVVTELLHSCLLSWKGFKGSLLQVLQESTDMSCVVLLGAKPFVKILHDYFCVVLHDWVLILGNVLIVLIANVWSLYWKGISNGCYLVCL